MERFGEKMFGLIHPKYGNQFWTAGRLRKVAKCRACDVDILKGKLCWRPVTNASNRADRVCSIICLEHYEQTIEN